MLTENETKTLNFYLMWLNNQKKRYMCLYICASIILECYQIEAVRLSAEGKAALSEKRDIKALLLDESSKLHESLERQTPKENLVKIEGESSETINMRFIQLITREGLSRQRVTEEFLFRLDQIITEKLRTESRLIGLKQQPSSIFLEDELRTCRLELRTLEERSSLIAKIIYLYTKAAQSADKVAAKKNEFNSIKKQRDELRAHVAQLKTVIKQLEGSIDALNEIAVAPPLYGRMPELFFNRQITANRTSSPEPQAQVGVRT